MMIAIVTGGALNDLNWLKKRLEDYDIKIAVDRGLEAFDVLALKPDIILGDFDSYQGLENISDRYPNALCEVFPAEKDLTDTELAMMKALVLAEAPAADVVIDLYGGFGNRVDHLYANLMLFSGLNEKSPKVRAIDPDNQIELLHPGTYVVERRTGFYVSFIPLDENAVLTIEGFKYSGEFLKITRNHTLGVSNELLDESGTCVVHSGRVFLMQCRDSLGR